MTLREVIDQYIAWRQVRGARFQSQAYALRRYSRGVGDAIGCDEVGSEWVVYSKPPFDGPARVLDYVGRYTHRVALSNDRILAVEDGRVRFRWRDYRHGRRLRSMTLSAEEFIRRFLLHVLPRGFHRIRHCGFLASRHRQRKLALCRRLLGMPPPEAPPAPPPDYRDRYEELTGDPLWQCPACRRGRMLVIETLEPAAEPPPPDDTS